MQRDFISQTGLKRRAERESVAGWGRSQAASARADAQKREKTLAEKQRYDTMVAELKATGAIPKTAVIRLPAQQIDVESLGFDDAHINADRGHHVSEEQAKEYICSAMVSVTVWGGQYARYYSRAGAAYVNNIGRYIRTAYSAEQYDEKTLAFMEVLKKHGY